MLDEKSIQKILIEYFIPHGIKRIHKIGVPNVFLYNWESDLLTIDNDNLVHEFEIKCSRFDYLNDAKKEEKHRLLSEVHDFYVIPNYFWYVHPEDVKIDEVQDYAGHIIIQKSGMNKVVKILKKAPRLHILPVNHESWEEIAKKLFYKLY